MNRHVARATAGLALALAAACAPGGEATVPEATLLSDSGGPIRLVLMAVSSPRRSALRNQELVQAVAGAFDPRTKLLILADPEMVLEPSPAPDRLSFVEVPEGLDFTIWPQDPFVVLHDPAHGSLLLAARGYGRAQDGEMARVVGRELGWPVKISSLFFAGGNLVADETRAFVGADLVRENAAELGISPPEVVERFEQELGRPVLVVGRAPQPVEHLDMALTPLGGARVAVGDAGWGSDAAERALGDDPDSVRRFESWAESHFFGDPRIETVTDPAGRERRAPRVEGGLGQAIAESRAIAADLDAIAADLGRAGYEVLRVPLLTSRARGSEPGYPMLSYNNVLTERVAGRERVYLAQYGLPALDDAARAAWGRAGFEVRSVSGVTTSAMYRGSLRCTAKVLERGPRGRD